MEKINFYHDLGSAVHKFNRETGFLIQKSYIFKLIHINKYWDRANLLTL